MQTGNGAQNRGEYQRHDNHLQQLDIAVTDHVKPLDRVFQYRVAGTVNGLQRQPEDHAHHQTDQNFFSEAPLFVTRLRQQQQ